MKEIGYLELFNKNLLKGSVLALLFGVLMPGCASHWGATQSAQGPSQAFIEEVRTELADLRQDLKVIQTEFGILDEKVQKQTSSSFSKHAPSEGGQVARLEKKIADLEHLVQKMATDLRNVSASTNQVLSRLQTIEQDMSVHEKRLDEVVKLKGTLSSISKAIGQPSAGAAGTKTYLVKAGDSLEKIARNHKVSVTSLKDLNHLKNDKIVVGQELKVPDEAP